MFSGTHTEAPVAQQRAALKWLLSMRRKAGPHDEVTAQQMERDWRSRVASGDGAQVCKECVRTVLERPHSYFAHYAQFVLDDLMQDAPGFRHLDLSGLAKGDFAADYFFYIARDAAGAGDRARYYSAVRAFSQLTDTSGDRVADINDVITTHLAPLACVAISPTNVVMGDVVRMDGSTSLCLTGMVTAWNWNFGDGGTATGSRVQHVFTNDGLYAVALTVTDDSGRTDTRTIRLSVGSICPVVSALGASNVTAQAATLRGRVLDTGVSNTWVAAYVCWGTSPGGQTTDSWQHVVALGFQAGDFSTTVSLTGTASSNYYYTCCATNSWGIGWADAVLWFGRVFQADVSPSVVTGTTAAVSVLGGPDGPESDLTYTWSVAGAAPGPVTVSPNGNNTAKNATATFGQAGAYSLQVVVSNALGQSTSQVPVTVKQTLRTIVVSPTSVNVATNASQAFNARDRDQFGNVMAPQLVHTWSASGGGTIDTGGLFTACSTVGGPYAVTAANGTLHGTAQVAVVAIAPVLPTVRFSLTNTQDVGTNGRIAGTNTSGTAEFIYPRSADGVAFWWADENGNGSMVPASAGLNMAGYDLKRIGDSSGISLNLDDGTTGGIITNSKSTGGKSTTSRGTSSPRATGSVVISNAASVGLSSIDTRNTTAFYDSGSISLVNVGDVVVSNLYTSTGVALAAIGGITVLQTGNLVVADARNDGANTSGDSPAPVWFSGNNGSGLGIGSGTCTVGRLLHSGLYVKNVTIENYQKVSPSSSVSRFPCA